MLVFHLGINYAVASATKGFDVVVLMKTKNYRVFEKKILPF